MRKKYGGDMQAFSHGEAYLTILQTQVGDRGLFILATHSPICDICGKPGRAAGR